MYNLLVSGHNDSWNGDPFVIERSRCMSKHEYTDEEIAEQFRDLNPVHIRKLCSLPCVFAYEDPNKNPKFGKLREVKGWGSQKLKVEYRVMPCDPFMTAEGLRSLEIRLDIQEWELGRTHWAVKNVDLARVLGQQGVALPDWASTPQRQVDIKQHQFAVALSFPGEHRNYIEFVAKELEQQLGLNTCFYDKFYEALLARPNLDLLLQEIYGERSNLAVVFVCAEYDASLWCGIEWRKIRELREIGDDSRIMYIRLGDGDVAGMTKMDGYVDARTRTPEDIAQLIIDRVGS